MGFFVDRFDGRIPSPDVEDDGKTTLVFLTWLQAWKKPWVA